MQNEWLTTGDAAKMLGVSRQHVVDLCDRGELAFSRTGTHRRIRRCDVQILIEPSMTREAAKSLWLHRAVLGTLMLNPVDVLEQARHNIAAWLPKHRSDGRTTAHLQQWQQIIDADIETVVSALTSTDEDARELRQNSPFAGVLSDHDRRQALQAFRERWEREHVAA